MYDFDYLEGHTVRSRIREISEERLFLLRRLRFSFLQKAQHPVCEVFGGIKAFLWNIRDLLVIDLLGSFGIKWRQKFDSWGVVLQERFVQIYIARILRLANMYQVGKGDKTDNDFQHQVTD